MALRKYFRAKIHRATVTHADLAYEGSVTIPDELLELSGIEEFEAVNIWNVTSGTRLETYAISGGDKTGMICVNGAAAHLTKPGDIVIIAAFEMRDPKIESGSKPTVVFVDEHNRPKELRAEIAGGTEA